MEPNIHFVAPHYTTPEKSSDVLLLLISNGGIKGAVYDTTKKRVNHFFHYPFLNQENSFFVAKHLKGVIQKEKLSEHLYKEVKIGVDSNKSTLVPNTIFDEKEMATYYCFNFDKQEEDILLFDDLISSKAKNIFSTTDYILKEVSVFNNPKIHHLSSALINSAKQTFAFEKPETLIDIHVLPYQIAITVVSEEKLQFHNTFEYQTTEDFSYYTLASLHELKITYDSKTLFRVMGNIQKNGPIHNNLNRYIPNIRWAESPENYRHDPLFKITDFNQHYGLFNLLLCE